jgi:hypothetical protein
MPVDLLAKMFVQSEHLRVLITQSAEELRSLNAALRDTLARSRC